MPTTFNPVVYIIFSIKKKMGVPHGFPSRTLECIHLVEYTSGLVIELGTIKTAVLQCITCVPPAGS